MSEQYRPEQEEAHKQITRDIEEVLSDHKDADGATPLDSEDFTPSTDVDDADITEAKDAA